MKRQAVSPAHWREWAYAVVLLGAVAVAYSQTWNAGFVWDDEEMVTENQVVTGPLGLVEIWTTNAADICPLTLTTFWAEFKLWGLHPAPWHWVTIALHGLTALALWRVLLALRVPGAWLGAALWALHPVQADSVALVAETKNTESGLFFLLSVWFFIRWLDAKSGRDYAMVLLFGALAMTAKSSTVVLPVILGLCSWWMEKQWNWRSLVALGPLLAMALAAGLVSILTQNMMGAGDPQWARSWPQRLIIAGDAVWFYLGKLAWPYPLVPVYPRWQPDASRPLEYLPLVALVALTAGLWIWRGRIGRFWFFALACFLVALMPVLGFANNMFARFSFVADHFQYLASMAPLALAGAGFVLLARQIGSKAEMIGAVPVAALGVATWVHAGIYTSELKLWAATLPVSPDCWTAYVNVGVVLDKMGHHDDAIFDYRHALELNPKSADGYNNLGAAFAGKGDLSAAAENYQRAVELNPAYYQAWTNLGVTHAKLGKRDEAIDDFQKSIAAMPTYAQAHYNLAIALFTKAEVDAAQKEFETAVALDPSLASGFNSLGVIAAQKGQLDTAQGYFERALAIRADDVDARSNLAGVFFQEGKFDEAIAQYRAVLAEKADYARAHAGLGAALMSEGKLAEARGELEEALRLSPDNGDARQNLQKLKAAAGAK
jgi:tetratricopeptide (TPR) repeat protein